MSGTTPTPGSGPANDDDNTPGAGQNPYAQPGDQPPAQPAQPAGEPTQPPAWSGPVGEPQLQPQERPQPPKTILTAVRLMYAGAVLSLVGLLFTLGARDSIREEVENTGDYAADELDAVVNAAVTFAVLVGLIGVALWLWMAAKNKQGKSWARTVATVLGALNILLTLLSFFGSGATGGTPGIGVVINVLMAILAAAILWFLYRPESNEYYAAVSRMNR